MNNTMNRLSWLDNDSNIINHLIDQGAIFYCSHSGGKDSQAMYLYLCENIPHDQIVVVHANLGEVEWRGVIDHIRNSTTHHVNVVAAKKTLLEMVKRRGKWPSPAYRQCTSDLKRGPIEKFIRHDLKQRACTVGVNCTGIRAQESPARARKQPLSINKSMTVNNRIQRTVWNWMPIFDWSVNQVWETIEQANQKPFWAYGHRGSLNNRLSCTFCIMGSRNDLRHGAKERPGLYRQYVELEKQIGHTMFTKRIDGETIPIPLEDHVGLTVNQVSQH